MIRAAILGSNGFIGRILAYEIEQLGVAVTRFDIAPGDDLTETLDVLNREKLLDTLHGVDWVFNFAGLLGTSELNERAFNAAQVNIIGMINVLDSCVRCGVSRVVYPSKPPIWNNIYTATKLSADHIATVYKLRGLDVRGIVVRNAYGPGQIWSKVRKVVPDMIQRALTSGCIEVFGTGDQPIDLIHVSDVATIFYAVAKVNAEDWPYTSPIETGLTYRLSANKLASIVRMCLPEIDVQIKHLPMREGEDEATPLPAPIGPFASDVAAIQLPARDLMVEISSIAKLVQRAMQTEVGTHICN